MRKIKYIVFIVPRGTLAIPSMILSPRASSAPCTIPNPALPNAAKYIFLFTFNIRFPNTNFPSFSCKI